MHHGGNLAALLNRFGAHFDPFRIRAEGSPRFLSRPQALERCQIAQVRQAFPREPVRVENWEDSAAMEDLYFRFGKAFVQRCQLATRRRMIDSELKCSSHLRA